MGTKRCGVCKEEKPVSEFYKKTSCRTGYKWACKVCDNKRVLAQRKDRLEEYNAVRRDWYKRNAEKQRLEKKEYKKKNPHKVKAHRAVRIALYQHRLVRKPCEVCGAKQVHFHHVNYNPGYELTGVWLCTTHHQQWHRKHEYVKLGEDCTVEHLIWLLEESWKELG